MGNNLFKRIIGILLLVAAVSMYVFFMQISIANMDDDDSRLIKSFYLEDRDSLDVVVMGASEIVNGYSAAEAYRTHGFTSAAYALSINSVILWKYELKDIERTQHPKVLIIETNGSLYEEDKYIQSSFCTNTLLDSMPLSLNKISASIKMSDNPLERIFPFIKYHYKWSDITDISDNQDLMIYLQGHARLRGAYSFLYRKRINLGHIYASDNKKSPLNAKAESALREFLAICKTSEIEHIVFMESPHVTNDNDMVMRRQRANQAAELIKDAGFDYIDFGEIPEIIGLDYSKDFFDQDHMVASGQRKFTQHLAGTITERYLDAPKTQSEKNRKEWDESAVLIEKYYKFYDNYIGLHSKDPYEKQKLMLTENKKIMRELDQIP